MLVFGEHYEDWKTELTRLVAKRQRGGPIVSLREFRRLSPFRRRACSRA
jgi:hypothetical protein